MGYTPGAKREVSSSTGYLVGVVNGLVFAAIGVALTASTGAKLFGVSHEELANSTKQDGVFPVEAMTHEAPLPCVAAPPVYAHALAHHA